MMWLFSALGLFLGWLALRDVRWDAFVQAFERMDPFWTAIFMLCMLAMIHLRTRRWEGMIRPLVPGGFDALFVRLTTWVGFAAVMVFPLRAGELYRCAVFRSRPERPGAGSAVLGALLLERALDGLAVACMLALALGVVLFRREGGFVSAATWVLWGLSSAGFAALLIASVWMARDPRSCINAFFRFSGLFLLRKNPRAALWMQKLSELGERLSVGIRHGLQSRALGRTVALTLAYWGANAAGVWALLKAFGLPAEPDAAMMVVGFSAVGVFIPGAPGHVGNFHEFAKLGLSARLSAALVAGPGMAFVVTLHAAQTLLYLGLGLAALAALTLRTRTSPK